jgi:hypothetical protein
MVEVEEPPKLFRQALPSGGQRGGNAEIRCVDHFSSAINLDKRQVKQVSPMLSYSLDMPSSIAHRMHDVMSPQRNHGL